MLERFIYSLPGPEGLPFVFLFALLVSIVILLASAEDR